MPVLAANPDATPVNASDLPPGAKVWPSGEIELPRFYILDEHEFDDEKTGKKVILDRNRLQHIAQRCNDRRKNTGDLVPIVVGHTVDNSPELNQPPIVGYCVDFSVEPFFDTGKYAIACTPVAKSSSHVQFFRDNPRRSVELWLDPDDIDPLALLGATTPKRDLGVHRFEKSLGRFRFERLVPNHVYQISDSPHSPYLDSKMMPNSVPPVGDSAMPQLDPQTMQALTGVVEQVLSTSPVMKQLEELLPRLASMAASAPGGEGEEPEDMMAPGEEGEDPQEEGEGEEPEEGDEYEGEEHEGEEETEEDDEDEDREGEPNKMNAHCSSTNTQRYGYSRLPLSSGEIVARYARRYGYDWPVNRNPSRFSKSSPLDRQVEKQVEKKKSQQEGREKLNYERENSKLKKRIEELESAARVTEVTEELRVLDEAGVAYRPEVELPTLVKMSKDKRDDRIKYLLEIATTSKRDLPNGGKVPVGGNQQAQVKMSRAGEGAVAVNKGGITSFEQAQAVANAAVSANQPKQISTVDVLKSLGLSVSGPGAPVQVR